jgi:amino acid permease
VCPSFSFFGSAGIVFFAFTNQAQLLPIYNNLDNPIKRRIIKVITRSTSIVTIFYLLMGFFGYLATASMTSEIVLFREPLPG